MSDQIFAARQMSRDSRVYGTILTVLGIFAIMSPVFTGLTVTFFVGMLLLLGGIVETIAAFQSETFGRGVLVFLFGGLSIAAGIATIATPVEAEGVLTIILIVFFILAGILDIVLGFKVREIEGWGWSVFSGVLTILLAVLLIANWPVSGIWAIGIYVGVKMIIRGWILTGLGRTGQIALTALQDERIDGLEAHVRYSAQTIQKMQSILADHTMMLMSLDEELRKKVSASDMDPGVLEMNKKLIEAQSWMDQTKEASKEEWQKIQEKSNEAFDKLQKKMGDINKKLKDSVGLDKKEK